MAPSLCQAIGEVEIHIGQKEEEETMRRLNLASEEIARTLKLSDEQRTTPDFASWPIDYQRATELARETKQLEQIDRQGDLQKEIEERRTKRHKTT
jgi:hypothetical protein